MSRFDFRDMLGGAAGSVTPDQRLADNVEQDEATASTHWSILSWREGVPALIEHLTVSVVLNGNVNGLCISAMLALMVARVGQKALTDLPADTGPQQRDHLIAEVQGVLDAMRRGDA